MSDVPFVAVTYDGLPISSGGAHSLGRTTRRVAHEAMVSFLEMCTEPMGRREYAIAVSDVPQLSPSAVLLNELERRFGRGRILVLDEDEVADALDFFDDVHPQATNRWGMAPISLNMTAQFRLLDPRARGPLPGQTEDLFYRVGYRNESRLFLDNRARLGLTFCIPQADDAVLGRVIPWLQEHLPCRLSPKHWRGWTPTKAGTLRGRVLDVSTLS